MDPKDSLLQRLGSALHKDSEAPSEAAPQSTDQPEDKPGDIKPAASAAKATSTLLYQKPEPGKKNSVLMRNQKGDPDCLLCQLASDPLDPADFRNEGKFYEEAHQKSYRIWSEWNPREKAAVWTARVVRVCQEMGIEIDAKEVAKHFRDHRIEQPAMPGPIRTDEFLRQAGELRDRYQVIIQSIYRQKFLTSRQIATVFFGRGRNWAAAKKAAQTDCNPLAQAHFLYKLFPSEADQERVQKFLDSTEQSKEERDADPLAHFAMTNLWYIGKRSIPLLMNYYDLSFQPGYTNYAESVRNETMIHDIRANEVFVACARKINEADGKIETEWGELLLEYNPLNWYGPGPRLINMGFVDPITKIFIKLKPDGFAALSLEDPSGQIPSGLLPFWIEYDRGSKDTIDVATQIFNYHLLALSGTPGKRFPELQVDKYTPPMIMVFRSEEKMKLIHKRFMEIVREKNISSGAPIFFALESDWFQNPFAPGICMNAWSEELEEVSFLDSLIRSSKRLLQEGSLGTDSVLTIDAEAAPAKGDGAASSTGREQGRETYAEQRESAALESKKQEFFDKYLGGKRPEEVEDLIRGAPERQRPEAGAKEELAEGYTENILEEELLEEDIDDDSLKSHKENVESGAVESLVSDRPLSLEEEETLQQSKRATEELFENGAKESQDDFLVQIPAEDEDQKESSSAEEEMVNQESGAKESYTIEESPAPQAGQLFDASESEPVLSGATEKVEPAPEAPEKSIAPAETATEVVQLARQLREELRITAQNIYNKKPSPSGNDPALQQPTAAQTAEPLSPPPTEYPSASPAAPTTPPQNQPYNNQPDPDNQPDPPRAAEPAQEAPPSEGAPTDAYTMPSADVPGSRSGRINGPDSDFPEIEDGSQIPGQNIQDYFSSHPEPTPRHSQPEADQRDLPEQFPDIENEIAESDVQYARKQTAPKPPKPIGDELDTSLPPDMPPPPVREEMTTEDNTINIGGSDLPPEEEADPAARRRARRKRG